MLKIGADGVHSPSEEDIAQLRHRFVDERFLRFSPLIAGNFHSAILVKLKEAGFQHIEREDGGSEMRTADPRIDYGLHYMLNQPEVLTAVGHAIGHDVHLFMGHSLLVTRRFRDDWHNDIHAMIELNGDRFQRVVPMAIVFADPSGTARLELKRVGETEPQPIALEGPGDGILYQSGPGLHYRFVAEDDDEPAVLHLGWFHQLME